jgi:putative endonuclease
MSLYFVYILASKRNGTLYVGMTNNLLRRIMEHRKGSSEGFTKRYHVSQLVYYEETGSVEAAISREKQLKNWKRIWKLELIEKENPNWKDLSILLLDTGASPA